MKPTEFHNLVFLAVANLLWLGMAVAEWRNRRRGSMRSHVNLLLMAVAFGVLLLLDRPAPETWNHELWGSALSLAAVVGVLATSSILRLRTDASQNRG